MAGILTTLRKYEKQLFALLLLFLLIYKFLNAKYGTGWQFAAGYSYILFLVFSAWALIKKDDFLFRAAILFTLVAGFTELISDWWLVSVNESLVYFPDEPMIVSSPLYMPFSWSVVFLQVGFLGWLYGKGKSFRTTVIATTLIGLLFIPLFEHLAKDANWWYYQNCRMIGNVPYYIIASEVAVSASLPFFFRLIEKQKSYGWAFVYGIIQGLWIWVSCMIAYFLLK